MMWRIVWPAAAIVLIHVWAQQKQADHPGGWNAITDVPAVRAGDCTVREGTLMAVSALGGLVNPATGKFHSTAGGHDQAAVPARCGRSALSTPCSTAMRRSPSRQACRGGELNLDPVQTADRIGGVAANVVAVAILNVKEGADSILGFLSRRDWFRSKEGQTE